MSRLLKLFSLSLIASLGLFANPAAAETPRGPAATTAAYSYKLSSGCFGLPSNAASVDWMLINNSTSTQSARVTVYRCNLGAPKTTVAPGALTVSLAPSASTHNANSVGSVFQVGYYYEVVVESNSALVLPTASVWSNNGGAVIPGTSILPAQFERQ